MNTIRTYGWKRQQKDNRDVRFKAKILRIPSSVDLRPHDSPIEDQSTLGSCTANSLCGIMQYNEVTLGSNVYQPYSRLFVYYNERAIEGDINDDAGANIRDGIKTLATNGVCYETTWPYNIDQFTIQPNNQSYTEALSHSISNYSSLDGQTPAETLLNVKTALSMNHPVSFGFDVYESFEGDDIANTGIMSVPASTEEMVGGHAVVIVGYDDSKQWLIVRNSWGSDWGDKGYFYMPYQIVSQGMTSDFWIIIR